MALIPYAHLPPPHDPPILVAEQPLEEYYCGDARCDCATANVMFAGVPMVIDLGTTRVDYHNEREGQTTPAREALRETMRATLQDGAINQLREHYVKVREYGRDYHFRYMDYTRLQAGDVVGWEQIFRHLGTPIYTLSTKAQEDGPSEEIRLGMADAYCVIPRCDCQRVVWSVVTAPPDSQSTRPLGTVEFRFATGQHSVLSPAQGVNPNQLFMIVANLLRARPDFISEAQQRYAFMREQVTPLLQQQQRSQNQPPNKPPVAGRNDACPCGSGKKFKRCHGR